MSLLKIVKSKKNNSHREGTSKFMVLNENSNYRVDEVYDFLSKELNFNQGTELREISSEIDKLSFTHISYQQFYKGIKVEHGIYKAHLKTNQLKSVSGEYYPVQLPSVRPVLSPEKGFDMLLDYIGATSYIWEGNPDYEKPKEELVIIPVRDAIGKVFTYHLAYKYHITTTVPFNEAYYFIDAINGNVVAREQRLCNASGDTMYSGTQTITTQSVSGHQHKLLDSPRGIHTQNNLGNDYMNVIHAEDFIDANNNWSAAEWDNAAQDQAGLDAHWGLEMTYDYFDIAHQRDSYDGTGGQTYAYVHVSFGSNPNNAARYQNDLLFGDGDGVEYSPLVSLDICAHEYSHGICQYSADLVNEGESGALNEGLSDIWAACVVNRTNEALGLDKNIWLIGDEVTLTRYADRDMSNPKGVTPNVLPRPQPDTYGGYTNNTQNWYNINNCTPDYSNDYCGIHTNSGVLNHWFYLLTEGSEETDEINDNMDVFNVFGIGIEDAAQIVYRMETVYLSSNSNYEMARMYAIQSAIDLFGECSTQHISTQNAFHAVGIGQRAIDCCEVAFHLEHQDQTAGDVFSICEDIYLNGFETIHTQNSYFLDILEIDPNGNTVGYNIQYDPTYPQLGWTQGHPDLVNITDVFKDPITQNPIVFKAGFTYRVKLAIWINGCGGWTEVSHEFTIEDGNCCENYNADFSMNLLDNLDGVTLEVFGFETNDGLNAIHEWYVYSRPNGTTGPFVPVYFTTTLNGGSNLIFEDGQYGLEYNVVHKVISDCGEICYLISGYLGDLLNNEEKDGGAGSVVDCSITDDFPLCGNEPFSAPTNLSAQGFTLNWDAIPNAIGYIISSPGIQIYQSCTCKFPISLNPIQTIGTSYNLPLQLQDNCFVWQVTAICADGTESPVSTQECYGQSEIRNPRLSSTGNNGITSVFPNPSNGKMTITIHLDYDSEVIVGLYDMLGHKIENFNETVQLTANNTMQFEWNAQDQLKSGVYIAKFQTKLESFTKTIVIQ